ncbi:MAG: transcriptional repressor [Ruminococcaceae bacterium]|nr:transcriptional repressor [Oscillospiraceae bacterium]
MTSAEILQKHGIRPSLTRVLIYDYLREHRTHPTADEIYSALSPEAPTLSKTTVYNTMKLLSAEGVIKTITIEEQQARFDACTDIHGHFLCKSCGKVYDFDTKLPCMKIPEGFGVDVTEIYCTGKCEKCN